MTKRKSHKRPKQISPVSATEVAVPALLGELDLLWQRRQPYGDLLADIVGETFERFSPPSDTPIVEIGSGAGQLRAWLPPAARQRTVHTDPAGAALQALRERLPDAKVRLAAAERLPFADGSCGGVIGLCVFDAIEDEQAAVAEIARVLAVDGRFFHFMDMATLLEAPFQKLAASGLVPIPNVFGDPGDHEWPLDIVLVKRDWLLDLRDFAVSIGHPLSSAFSGYLRSFLDPPFEVHGATNIFKAIASNGESRRALLTLLESAGRLAHSQGHPAIEPLPFQSGRYLQSVLETRFRENGAFRIEMSGIVSRSRFTPRRSDADVRYRSLCVGHQRVLDDLPRRLLVAAADGPRAAALDSSQTLIEVGLFVFVAQKIRAG